MVAVGGINVDRDVVGCCLVCDGEMMLCAMMRSD